MTHNYISFKLKGMNHTKQINTLHKDLDLLNVKQIDYNILQVSVPAKDCKKFKRKIVDKFEILEVKEYGFKYKVIKLFKQWGIISALFLLSVLFSLSSLVVLRFQIEGNVNIKNAQVISALKEYGIQELCFKNSINTAECERYLKSKFENLSLVSVLKKGSTLIISIKEPIYNDEYNERNEFSPLISQYDCRITEIELIQGTLNVKTGQIIKAGDVLVHPYILDSQGHTRKVKAQANITAEVWIKSETKCFDKYKTFVRTGKAQKTSRLTFNETVLKDKNNSTFVTYQEEISKTNISKFLPITYEKIYYYETIEKEIITDFNLQIETLIETCKQNALLQLEDCDIIKKEYSNISSQAGVHYVSYIVEVERKIGKYKN